MLKLLSRSPAHLKAALDKPPKPTPAMVLGTLAHALILENRVEYHIKPDDYDGRTKAGRSWKDAHSDKPALSIDEAEVLAEMREAVLVHPVAAALLSGAGGRAEVSLFGADLVTGQPRKARLDWLTYSQDGTPWIADIKTCEDASPEAFMRASWSMRYHVQAAYYVDLLHHVLGGERPVFVFVAVEKEPPYACAVYRPTADALRIGDETWRRDLDRYAQCAERNEWPAYGDGMIDLGVPGWVRS